MTLGTIGSCTMEDVAALEGAMAELRRAEEALTTARSRAGAVMREMLDKGARRRAVAALAAVSDQTVTNLAHGRPGKKETTG